MFFLGVTLFLLGGLITSQEKKSSLGKGLIIAGLVLWVFAIVPPGR